MQTFGLEVGHANRVAHGGNQIDRRPRVEHDLARPERSDRVAVDVEPRSGRRVVVEIDCRNGRIGYFAMVPADRVGQVRQRRAHRCMGRRLANRVLDGPFDWARKDHPVGAQRLAAFRRTNHAEAVVLETRANRLTERTRCLGRRRRRRLGGYQQRVDAIRPGKAQLERFEGHVGVARHVLRGSQPEGPQPTRCDDRPDDQTHALGRVAPTQGRFGRNRLGARHANDQGVAHLHSKLVGQRAVQHDPPSVGHSAQFADRRLRPAARRCVRRVCRVGRDDFDIAKLPKPGVATDQIDSVGTSRAVRIAWTNQIGLQENDGND
ncbi:MAG TPA: hypothetical protein DD670_08005 [Planctomycetaceae bacterium]|nr:hypothetical protein [Planctomycetaceae bacterium]